MKHFICITLIFTMFSCQTANHAAEQAKKDDEKLEKLTELLAGIWEFESTDLYKDSTQVVPYILEASNSHLCDSIAKLLPAHRPVSKMNLTYVDDITLKVDKEYICGIPTETVTWKIKILGNSTHNNWQTGEKFTIVEYDDEQNVKNSYDVDFFNIDAASPSGEVVKFFNNKLWVNVNGNPNIVGQQIKFCKQG